MKQKEREEYVQYQLKSARETFDAAIVLAENQHSNSVVNRLYYAAFYAVIALLVSRKIETKTHSSTKSQFSLHFVKTGVLDKKYGHLFSKLFDWRQRGDYGNLFDYQKNDVEPLFDKVKDLIEKIEELN